MRARCFFCLALIPTLAALILWDFRESPAEDAKDPGPASFECRWAATPIVVDGVADEPAWKSAQVIDGFAKPWLPKGPEQKPKTATKARLLWDKDNLYFFADLEDADLFADVTEHDGQTWDNDVFELFFKPAADKPGYFEFQVNAANTVFDCFFPKSNLANLADQKKVGKFHVDAKVKLRGTLNKRDDVDGGWSVEGKIPWADFLRAGGRPETGETWGCSLCRYDYNKDWKQPDLSTTSSIEKRKVGAMFHQTEDYSRVRFVGPERAFGIDKYVPVTTSTVVGSPDPPLPYRVKRLYPKFSPTNAILAKAIPGTDQLILISQPQPYAKTSIVRVKDDPEVTTKELVTLLDTPDDGSAFDLVFHPKFAENGFIYVGWNSAVSGAKKDTKEKFSRITRYSLDRKPPYKLDAASAVTIIEWPSNGHNGCAICFGTDGMLYVTSGDGTSDSDTNVMGQKTDSLLSKVLRIDVEHPAAGKQYSVPKDNPFLNDARFVPETWAYGLRNPWRITCDETTGHIWVGNNGQDIWETAYLVRKGDNYGWSVMEGSHPFYLTRTPGPTPIVKPTIEHHHAEFRSLTGGIVDHGEQFPDLKGAYLYGDYSTGRLWGMKHDGKSVLWHKELAQTRLQLTYFGRNTRGELLLCDHRGKDEGGIYTLEPTPKDEKPSTFPRKLSDSGLFDSVKGHRMKPGVIPYSVNASFWSDGMYKERYFMLPPGEKIGFTRKNAWNFPEKTVIVKSFALPQAAGDTSPKKWIETRFFTKQGNEWSGYSYLWNDSGTDAELVPAGGLDREYVVEGKKQVWHYPSRAECMLCHSRAANFVLGLSEVQLNRTHDYDGKTDHQFRVYDHLDLFKPDFRGEVRKAYAEAIKSKTAADPAKVEDHKVNGLQARQREPKTGPLLEQEPELFRKLVNPYDPKEDLTARARSWLHANCSSCHVEAGGGNALMELEFHTALDKMRVIGVAPVHTTFNLPDAKLVAPGHPERSVLVHRVGTRGTGQMPPLASNRVDEAGLKMLKEWVAATK